MRRILLVEDEDILRETFELIIASQPYLANTAENGQVALQLCKKTTYDLILLDLMMPVLDGVGFLKEFVSNKPDRTKIIILSNLSSGRELHEAMSLGAERSVVKSSLSPRELLAMVRYELEAV
jgi:DNA-binding response OmpR family regulator